MREQHSYRTQKTTTDTEFRGEFVVGLFGLLSINLLVSEKAEAQLVEGRSLFSASQPESASSVETQRRRHKLSFPNCKSNEAFSPRTEQSVCFSQGSKETA